MAPQEDGQPACPDNLHSLFQLAETLFRAAPLCSPCHTSHPPTSPPKQEAWEQLSWLRLLHTLLFPLLTLQRKDLPSLQHTLNHHNSHTITALDTCITQNCTVTVEVV